MFQPEYIAIVGFPENAIEQLIRLRLKDLNNKYT